MNQEQLRQILVLEQEIKDIQEQLSNLESQRLNKVVQLSKLRYPQLVR